MPTIINFKICDNSADCNALTGCPKGCFSWDDKEKTIKIDNSKCSGCSACEDFCPIGAIRFAKDDKQFAKIQKEIEKDPRTRSELMVDRYGADTVAYTLELSKEKFAKRIQSKIPVIVEFNSRETIECLLKSIPVRFIQNEFDKNASYEKLFIDKKDFADWEIKTTPCLKFYREGRLVGQIDGYFDDESKFELFRTIREIASSK